MKFFICETCKQLITKIEDKSIPVHCCGNPMKELVPGTTDGATEKHVPVIEQKKNMVTVSVGENEHPMLDVHYIEWIVIKTTMGFQLKKLTPDMEPKAEFCLSDSEELIEAYEYCNIHSLWKSQAEAK